MTPEEYVLSVQALARQHAYNQLIDFAERFGQDVEDQLTAEQVRILRVHLKHADMVLSKARSCVTTG